MIKIESGNLITADAEALVNTVNCVGVMGKGIALQFKMAFPENFAAYQKACRAGKVQIGQTFTFFRSRLENPLYIINFPTKTDWRNKSRLEDIEAGLKALVSEVKTLGIQSIAIPPLGCGNGGLEWQNVRPRIEAAFSELPEVRVLLFEPGHRPEPDQHRINTRTPRMTMARALALALMKNWPYPEYRFSQLEVQKLAYFLQEVGETALRLQFTKAAHGPYADQLKFLLQKLEGHYIRGYGDGNQPSQMYLLPGAIEASEKFLETEIVAQERLQRVLEIIDGFEDPYGMELLATVHWIAKESPTAAHHFEAIYEAFQNWGPQKREKFQKDHIYSAWEHLREVNMLPYSEK